MSFSHLLVKLFFSLYQFRTKILSGSILITSIPFNACSLWKLRGFDSKSHILACFKINGIVVYVFVIVLQSYWELQMGWNHGVQMFGTQMSGLLRHSYVHCKVQCNYLATMYKQQSNKQNICKII